MARGVTNLQHLQALRGWLGNPDGPATKIDRLVTRLGSTAVPLLGRELCSEVPARREAARVGLLVAGRGASRARVIDELRTIATRADHDDVKAIALEILAALGAIEVARFADPSLVLRRSVSMFAGHLESRADITSAADLLVRQAATIDVEKFLALLCEIAPAETAALASELVVRLDLDAEVRAQIAHDFAPPQRAAPVSRARRITVSLLVDAAARMVVIASRKLDARRARRWAVLISHTGKIDDCLYDIAPLDAATTLVTNLLADGYQIASTDRDRARAIITGAARRTGAALTSQYYFGRDLLDLEDAHVAMKPRSQLGRAIELVAEGKHADASALLERCDPACPDVAAAHAAIALAAHDYAAAIPHLERAIAADPAWSLHHWNLGVARYRLRDPRAASALRTFVELSGERTGLIADPDQPGRVACAERMLSELR